MFSFCFCFRFRFFHLVFACSLSPFRSPTWTRWFNQACVHKTKLDAIKLDLDKFGAVIFSNALLKCTATVTSRYTGIMSLPRGFCSPSLKFPPFGACFSCRCENPHAALMKPRSYRNCRVCSITLFLSLLVVKLFLVFVLVLLFV